MGKQPSEFVPIKYSNRGDDSESSPMMRVAIGSAFVLLLIQLYRTFHGKGGTSSGSSFGSRGSGGFGGQNPMGNMGKSNV